VIKVTANLLSMLCYTLVPCRVLGL